ncbi:protein MAINTENANCE OF MERISTEMS-like [Mercurialis annua]|nr:protein MAINTENANCE OF MERISTEMS-like [Mercurialis annua]
MRFDRSRYEDIIWEPYTDEILSLLPAYCLEGRRIWRSVVPLIYYHIVEWHHPDRVLQQFGLQQPIPLQPRQDHVLHSYTMRGSDNWRQTHAFYIDLWDHRLDHVVDGPPFQGPPPYHSEYMEWFRRVTRRWITPQGAREIAQADAMETMHMEADISSRFRSITRSSQLASQEERRDVTIPPTHPSIEPFRLPAVPQPTIDPQTIRSRRRPRQPPPPAPRPLADDPMPEPVFFHPFRGPDYYHFMPPPPSFTQASSHYDQGGPSSQFQHSSASPFQHASTQYGHSGSAP